MQLTGRNLRIVRRACNLTQAQLARSAGLDFSYVSKLETGLKPLPPQTERKIRAALPVDDSTMAVIVAVYDAAQQSAKQAAHA